MVRRTVRGGKEAGGLPCIFILAHRHKDPGHFPIAGAFGVFLRHENRVLGTDGPMGSRPVAAKTGGVTVTSKDHTRPGDNEDAEEIVWEHPAITNVRHSIDQALEPFREMQRKQEELLRHQQEQMKRAMGREPVRRRKQPAPPANQQPVQTATEEDRQQKNDQKFRVLVEKGLELKEVYEAEGSWLQLQDVAEALGISRTTVWRTLHKRGLDWQGFLQHLRHLQHDAPL